MLEPQEPGLQMLVSPLVLEVKPGPLPKQLVLPTPEPVSRKAFYSGPFVVWDLQRSSLV